MIRDWIGGAPEPGGQEAGSASQRNAAVQRDRAGRAYPLNTDSPHVAAILAAGGRVRFYLIGLLGMEANKIRALLPVLTAEMAARQVVPVFVTDLLDYRVFRDARVIFEAVPPLADSATLMPGLNWAARRREIVALVREKWQPAGEISLGPKGDPDAMAGTGSENA